MTKIERITDSVDPGDAVGKEPAKDLLSKGFTHVDENVRVVAMAVIVVDEKRCVASAFVFFKKKNLKKKTRRRRKQWEIKKKYL